jgi:hypothetical protein
VLHNLKLKRIFAVLIPSSLQVAAVVLAAPQQPSMLPKPRASVHGAPNIKLSVHHVPDFIDNVLRHACLRYNA